MADYNCACKYSIMDSESIYSNRTTSNSYSILNEYEIPKNNCMEAYTPKEHGKL